MINLSTNRYQLQTINISIENLIQCKNNNINILIINHIISITVPNTIFDFEILIF